MVGGVSSYLELDKDIDVNIDADNLHVSQYEIEHAVELSARAAYEAFCWVKIKEDVVVEATSVVETKFKKSFCIPSSEEASSKSGNENPLSDLVPGYAAPFSLGSNSTTTSTSTDFNNVLTRRYNETKGTCKKLSDKWFGLEDTLITPELLSDIAIVRNRNYLDPKKFYKSSDIPSTRKGGLKYMPMQLGTVIEGAAEYYSGRLSKKKRRVNLTEQTMNEVYDEKGSYVRKKFQKMSKEKVLQGLARSHRKKKRKGGFARRFESSKKTI